MPCSESRQISWDKYQEIESIFGYDMFVKAVAAKRLSGSHTHGESYCVKGRKRVNELRCPLYFTTGKQLLRHWTRPFLQLA